MMPSPTRLTVRLVVDALRLALSPSGTPCVPDRFGAKSLGYAMRTLQLLIPTKANQVGWNALRFHHPQRMAPAQQFPPKKIYL